MLNRSADSTSAPGPQPVLTRLWRTFVIAAALAFAGYLARTISDEPHQWWFSLASASILCGTALALAWFARLAWTRVPNVPLRCLLTFVLAWHALFGVVMLARRILSRTTSNDDLVHKLWPHVVHWINSLE
ncbi:MAG: hypothetical protein JNL28_04720 [Planctomycetes bacterium]|nr:hypothetical protein [Planctomycetota bacterium]